MSRLSNVQKERPELLEDTDFSELIESADKIHSIKVAAESEGGRELISFLLMNVVNSIHVLSGRHQEATHTELVSIISRMSANIATARFLSTAKGDIENLDEQIAEMLRE